MPKLESTALPYLRCALGVVLGLLALPWDLRAQPPSEPAEPTDLIRFRVGQLRSDEGSLACGLFTAEGWLRTGTEGEGGSIEDGVAVCEFPGVPPGLYGISAYHDENGNGELDSNLFRIPKEGTTASNDARGRFGPPKFEDARFDYTGGVLELEGTMHYR